MAIVPMKDLLIPAKKNKYAVAQCNINGLDWAEAILRSAQEENSPIIVAASDRLIDYLGGFNLVSKMIYSLVNSLGITVPVALHLDHGRSVQRCKKAIDSGFTSVMIDGSHAPIEENIIMTKEVVEYAKAKGISVEAEVGSIGGNEDGFTGKINYADINECILLVKETGVDALAAALGSVHGKYKGTPKLGFSEMEAISKAVNIPLVLHGASGIPKDKITKSIELGHRKINFNTELNIAWIDAIRKVLSENPTIFDPQQILSKGKEAIVGVVKEKINVLGSKDRANLYNI